MKVKRILLGLMGAYALMTFVCVPLYVDVTRRFGRSAQEGADTSELQSTPPTVNGLLKMEATPSGAKMVLTARATVSTTTHGVKASKIVRVVKGKEVWKAQQKKEVKTVVKAPPGKTKKTEEGQALTEFKKAAQFKLDIVNYLIEHESMCLNDWKKRTLAAGMKPLCPCTPKTLVGWRNVSLEAAPLDRTLAENQDIQLGGHWEPADCTARYRVVVIVPFRDRDYHLSVLLRYLHPALRGQMLNYTILVVEQNQPETFNKAALMNVAFKYAKEQLDPDCVIFNDVDIIPEDGRHFYTCRPDPLHLGAYHTRHKYRVIYGNIFGGVTSFRASTFEKVNGFSNRFFGWGGEDDDMSVRLREHKLRILRDPRAVAGYTALVHSRDKGNVQHNRGLVLKTLFHDRDTDNDGLNSLHYVLHKRRLYPLYTWLHVDILNDSTKIGFKLKKP